MTAELYGAETTSSGTTSKPRWIQSLRQTTKTPRARLICFAHAGGSARSFRPWIRAFAEDIEILAVQLPGRDERANEGFVEDLHSAAATIGALSAPWVGRGAVFFGHSLGALLAFETATWLQQHRALCPAHLFVSACQAPSVAIADQVHQAADSVLIERILGYGGTPPEVFQHSELRAAMLPVIRDDYRLRESYRYRAGPKLRCPVSVCSGRRDFSVSDEALLAWRDVTLGPFHWQCFSGGHFYLHSQLSELASFIKQQLRLEVASCGSVARVKKTTSGAYLDFAFNRSRRVI